MDFTDLKVSGRMKRRIVNVSRMIAKPQLFSPPPTTSCQNVRMLSSTSSACWGMIASGSMVSTGAARTGVWSSTKSTPPWLHGLHRSRRQAASTRPRSMPYRRTAVTAYSEQVGWYLQRRGMAGEMARWYRRTGARTIGPQGGHWRRVPGQPGLVEQLAERLAQAGLALLGGELGRLGPGDDHEVVGLGQRLGLLPERLAQRPLDAVALDGAADPAADGDAQARALVAGPARERVEDQVPARVRAALAVDAVELAAARQAPALAPRRAAAGRRPRPARRPRLRGEASAALAAATAQDVPARLRAHARTETVRAGALALLWLVGALHRRVLVRSAAGQYRQRPSAASVRRHAARARREDILRDLRTPRRGRAERLAAGARSRCRLADLQRASGSRSAPQPSLIIVVGPPSGGDAAA